MLPTCRGLQTSSGSAQQPDIDDRTSATAVSTVRVDHRFNECRKKPLRPDPIPEELPLLRAQDVKCEHGKRNRDDGAAKDDLAAQRPGLKGKFIRDAGKFGVGNDSGQHWPTGLDQQDHCNDARKRNGDFIIRAPGMYRRSRGDAVHLDGARQERSCGRQSRGAEPGTASRHWLIRNLASGNGARLADRFSQACTVTEPSCDVDCRRPQPFGAACLPATTKAVRK